MFFETDIYGVILPNALSFLFVFSQVVNMFLKFCSFVNNQLDYAFSC